MRIISQDGITDIPYENSVLNVFANYGYNKEKNFNEIIGYRIMTYAGDNPWTLGDYSTKEKALEVMEMLQNQYKRFMTTALMDIKNENIYFRFPADEVTEKSV